MRPLSILAQLPGRIRLKGIQRLFWLECASRDQRVHMVGADVDGAQFPITESTSSANMSGMARQYT